MSSILSSSRGQHTSHLESVVDDESFALAARSFVHTHACQKGQPNVTGKMFADWVKAEYSQVVHETTARRWLHHLGFNRIHHQKGVYFDGHDREDVVVYREEFLRMMDELDRKSLTCTGHVPTLSPGEKPLIRVAHYECTFYANCDQTLFWADSDTNVLRQKSLGASIMVSDFIDEVSGFLRDEADQARLLVKINKDGYLKNDDLMKQVTKAVDIFERVHPDAVGVFLFDNVPSHRKMADDAFNANKMNVGSGGKQPVMRDTIWGSEVQNMAFQRV